MKRSKTLSNCVVLLIYFSSIVSRAQLTIDQCCRYTSDVTVTNSGEVTTSDGRRATFFCALDAAGVPNFDLGFLEQQKGSARFALSIYLRDPIRDSSIEELWSVNQSVGINATLKFEVGKGLSLLDERQKQVWTTVPAAGFMLDCTLGNLILFDEMNRTVWQSFDHPTDTLLQGQDLRQGMKLMSKRSSYSLVMEAAGLALYDKQIQEPYWILAAGGVANDSRSVTTSTTCGGFNATIFDVGMMMIYPSISSTNCISTTVRFRSYPGANRTRFMKLSEDGSLQVFDWNLGSKAVDYDFLVDGSSSSSAGCALPASCGVFGVCRSAQCSCLTRFRQRNPSDTTAGCDAEEVLDSACNGRVQEMVAFPGMTSQFNKYRYVNQSFRSSAEACSSSCGVNCSCRVAFYEKGSAQCFVYGENFQSFQAVTENSADDFVAFVKLAVAKSSSNATLSKAAIAGITIAACILLLGLVMLAIWRLRKKPGKFVELQEDLDEEAFLDSLPGLPPRYSMKALEEATNGFSSLLGRGGFGEVYFGTLSNGTQVAVKKLASAHQGKKEFRAEVATIGNIHHVNLVRLRGFCAEGSNRLLVYDFMSNGSLDKFLFGKKNATDSEALNLDWKTRFNIALGTARGLAYLHESCKERILHLDVKPQNILLDEKFGAKVADFGLAKLIGSDETHVFTTMRGTPGYLAPEWLTSAISEKSDVYSYGIVLLELVSGRHNFRRSAEDVMLSAWAFSKLEEGRLLDVLDEELKLVMDEKQMKEAETAIVAALWCIQVDPELRPSMSNLILVLEGLVEAQLPPSLRRSETEKISDDIVVFSSLSGYTDNSSMHPR